MPYACTRSVGARVLAQVRARSGASRTGRSRARGSRRSTRAARASAGVRRAPERATWRGCAATPASTSRPRSATTTPTRDGTRRTSASLRCADARRARRARPRRRATAGARPRVTRVEVVRKPLACATTLAERRRRARARRRGRARGISPRQDRAPSTTTLADDGEDGLRARSTGARRCRAAARGQMKRYIAGTSTNWMRGRRADVAVGDEERELRGTPTSAPPTNARSARACGSSRSRSSDERRRAATTVKSAYVGLPNHGDERSARRRRQSRAPARRAGDRAAIHGACATSCSATLESRNQSKKLSRWARSQ